MDGADAASRSLRCPEANENHTPDLHLLEKPMGKAVAAATPKRMSDTGARAHADPCRRAVLLGYSRPLSGTIPIRAGSVSIAYRAWLHEDRIRAFRETSNHGHYRASSTSINRARSSYVIVSTSA